jgi:hypothetical protein
VAYLLTQRHVLALDSRTGDGLRDISSGHIVAPINPSVTPVASRLRRRPFSCERGPLVPRRVVREPNPRTGGGKMKAEQTKEITDRNRATRCGPAVGQQLSSNRVSQGYRAIPSLQPLQRDAKSHRRNRMPATSPAFARGTNPGALPLSPRGSTAEDYRPCARVFYEKAGGLDSRPGVDLLSNKPRDQLLSQPLLRARLPN